MSKSFAEGQSLEQLRCRMGVGSDHDLLLSIDSELLVMVIMVFGTLLLVLLDLFAGGDLLGSGVCSAEGGLE